jgi:dTDP-4-dehydrorhamnose reductase
VGWELRRSLATLGEVIGLDLNGPEPLRADLSRPETLADIVQTWQPDAIINAAAYTDVDAAQSQPERARVVNALAVDALACAARACGAWLVHFSTDYVFDGSGATPRNESAPTAPLNVYGCTKLEGEERVRASGCQHLIFRSSWVYGTWGDNFPKTILRLAAAQEELSVVDDQIGAPTGADWLADVTAQALWQALRRPELAGTYHATAAGETSRHGYACHVIEWARDHGHALRVRPAHIHAISSDARATAAPRPLNSRLDTQKLQSTFCLRPQPWQTGVERMLREWLRPPR